MKCTVQNRTCLTQTHEKLPYLHDRGRLWTNCIETISMKTATNYALTTEALQTLILNALLLATPSDESEALYVSRSTTPSSS